MQIQFANLEDIDNILLLQSKYHIDTIEEKDKKDGFVTTLFTKDDLSKLIQEKGLFIVKKDNSILAYAMAASWKFWSKWPMFKYMINELKTTMYKNKCITVDNSYQYGPICIDKSMRNTDVLKNLFIFLTNEMSKKYPVLITFINKTNMRSYVAHTRKLGLEVVDEFKYNNQEYYKLAFK
jgi:hypothetical protein